MTLHAHSLLDELACVLPEREPHTEPVAPAAPVAALVVKDAAPAPGKRGTPARTPAAELRALVLAQVAANPGCTGWDVGMRLRVHGRPTHEQTIYRALCRLERDGLVKSHPVRGRDASRAGARLLWICTQKEAAPNGDSL